MNFIYVTLVLWLLTWAGAFCLACYRLLGWDFVGWRRAFKFAWDDRYENAVWLPGLAFLAFAFAVTILLWVFGAFVL